MNSLEGFCSDSYSGHFSYQPLPHCYILAFKITLSVIRSKSPKHFKKHNKTIILSAPQRIALVVARRRAAVQVTLESI